MSVKDDVLDELAAGAARYELFIRGSADALGNRGGVVGTLDGGGSKVIRYLARSSVSPTQYLQTTRDMVVNGTYNNQQLSNLRADHIQHKLLDLDAKLLHSGILDGTVTKQIRAEDRNVLILLFVPRQNALASIK